ncbi:Spermidine synthase [Streptomyces netropsis]|uniref:Polyamine aminopropyltransferase n=1 Tax=Streptomyces syringium TaxID=76729 RepID=A0ABS4Y547_9ACTN|nr:polyamine aminopropyltransferase [Streptomyces syringium]MBP2403785.1 spermidine synthase [Streptomyces syringium]SPE54050.1 Spermidine synthase [Streptomyces netropsis]
MIYRPVPARLPVPAGLGRFSVLTTVFVCAACGLVYELELVALASYLIGDSVTQASVVLSVMVFAMGIGSLLAKRLRPRAALGFAAVEAGLALTGGLSAMALYACFAWYGQTRVPLVAFSLVIGILIGAEVPLLMTLIQRIRRQDAGGAVADLFAADYVGALVGGLAFPFLLLPMLGQLTGALLTGGVNAVAGGALVLWLFRGDLSSRSRWALVALNGLVLVLLAACSMLTGPFERAARHAVYGADIRVAVRTPVQEVVLTGGGRSGRPISLFMDGRLRVSGGDELRYHEGLVHPAMDGPHRRVLILGGGDGLALREVLRYPGVTSVTVVELDGAMVRLARTDRDLAALNRSAFRDPRVRVVVADAFGWLRGGHGDPGPFDVLISDLPDPAFTPSTKLYSQEFYGLAARRLAPGGRLAIHAGPIGARPRVFWTVDATVRSLGLDTAAYRVHGKGGGPSGVLERTTAHGSAGRGGAADGQPKAWGFLLASREPARLRLPADRPDLRTLTPATLAAAGRAAGHGPEPGLLPSTLMHPRYTD